MKRIILSILSLLIFCNGCIVFAEETTQNKEDLKQSIIDIKNQNKGLVTVADNDFCFNGNWQNVLRK